MGMDLPVASVISEPLFSLQVCVRVSGADKDSRYIHIFAGPALPPAGGGISKLSVTVQHWNQ